MAKKGPNFIRAKAGCKFVLTEHGMSNPIVSSKYLDVPKYGSRYAVSVPYSWIREGYVEEVEDGKE